MEPVIKKSIPTQVINEQAAYGPFDLKSFIESAEEDAPLRFRAELVNGKPLPTGMICTTDGIITGIPAKNTQGNYEILITVENNSGSTQTTFFFTIKPSLSATGTEYADQVKAQVWEALEQNLPLPDLGELYDRPLTDLDIYYLMERWGILTIWDAYNLDPPSEKQLLRLEGMSEHYHVYDRGSCLIACPKDLFSHERTLEDGLKTARAVAREVYKRDWTIELAGFEKLTRAAWIELQHLADKYGKQLEIINFNPRVEDIQLYNEQAQNLSIKNIPE